MIDTTTKPHISLSAIYRNLIRARLGMLDDAEAHYAEDVATLLAALRDALAEARASRRSIRIEERLKLK